MHLKFSEDIKRLLEQLAERPLTLADILAETDERGVSLVIGLLVLPFLFPMPPGFTTILGSACLLLSLQMIVGRRSPWLPKRVAQFRFPKILTQQLLNHIKQITRWIERFARPRWSELTRSRYTWRINGICLSWLTLLLMSPIPFTNPIPTIGILILVVAMLEADGLLMCVGYVFTTLVTIGFAAIGYILWRSPDLIQQWI